jgi:hypothetical protein
MILQQYNGNMKKKRHYPESQICISLYQWFCLQYPRHEPRYLRLEVGGQRTKVSQSILKAEGNKSGVSDVLIALPKGKYAGLWLEVKTEKGKMTNNQKIFHVEMYPDYQCKSGYGFDQCTRIITQYMRLPDNDIFVFNCNIKSFIQL